MNTIHISEPLGTRQATLPLLVGGSAAQLVVPGVEGIALRIEEQGGQSWLRLIDAATAMLNGMPLHSDVELSSGDVISLGEAQLVFHQHQGKPGLDVWHAAGNATIAPTLQEQLPGEEVSAGVREIIAAGDDPSAANATAPLGAARQRVRPALVIGILAAIVGVG